MKMVEILNRSIIAHGGIERWRSYSNLKMQVTATGSIWEIRDSPGLFNGIAASIDLFTPKVIFSGFPDFADEVVYTSGKTMITDKAGNIVKELYTGKGSFKGYDKSRQWDHLHAFHFLGHCLWDSTQVPRIFAEPGFRVIATGRWKARGQTWHRIQVSFPGHLPAHSTPQVYYIGNNGLIKRQDYELEIGGWAHIAHYIDEYADTTGVKLASKCSVYRITSDAEDPQGSSRAFSIECSNFQLTKIKQAFN